MKTNRNIEIAVQSFEFSKTVTAHKRLPEISPVPENEYRQEKGGLNMKPENETPLFYTKPIFVSKKYDLL